MRGSNGMVPAQPMLTFPGESDHSLSLGLAISSDGSTLVVLHVLGTFDLWRAPSWEEIHAGEVKEPSTRWALTAWRR